VRFSDVVSNSFLNRFELVDSEQRSKDHPETWGHPPQEVLNRVQPGYFVKVGVTHPELNGERFWGIVRKVGANLEIQIDQDMVNSAQHGLNDKDVLFVQHRHIFGIMDANGVTLWVAA